jgi:hypothetical protein
LLLEKAVMLDRRSHLETIFLNLIETLPIFDPFNDRVMGKAEGEGELWHGHVTALTGK